MAVIRRGGRVSRLLVRLLRRLALLRPRHGVAGRPPSPALGALMLAATALPNIAPASAQMLELEEASAQYGRLEEDDLAFWDGRGALASPQPMRVETARAWASVRVGDRGHVTLSAARDTWSGATPYITAPEAFVTVTGASAYPPDTGRVNRATLVPMARDASSQWVDMPGLVNLVTSASPETRNQFNLSATYEGDDFALDLGASVSDEPDFASAGLNLGGRWDLSRKHTTLSFAASRGVSDIDANLGVDNGFTDYNLYLNAASGPRITPTPRPGLVAGTVDPQAEFLVFHGRRNDRAIQLGLTQVLGKNATLSLGLAHDRASGFLENPYKLALLAFVNPAAIPGAPTQSNVNLFSVLEKRPDQRRQTTWNLHWAGYLPDLGAALHLDHRRGRDNWGIRSRATELAWVQDLGNGWSLTPRVRHYAQHAADFYQPYFLFAQNYPQVPGQPGVLDFSAMPVDYWSSDHRLASYGGRSLGLTLTRRFDSGLRLELGLEHYRHAAKWGLGGAEDADSDFSSNMANVVLAMDFAQRPEGHAGHAGHAHHAPGRPATPAGVMNTHMLETPGDFMLEYRYVRARQGGGMVRDGRPVSDAEVLAACGALGCPATPSRMTMDMHMLHFMYALGSDLNLMLMPQVMAMDMGNRALDGGFYTPVGGHAHGDMDLSGHASGGLGDTTAALLWRLYRGADGETLLGLGLSLPTGSVSGVMAHHGGELMDYGMQLGSGTWDFTPSLTWTDGRGAWSWGAQLAGVKRLQRRNASGYALGDVFQATAWAGYAPVRGVSLTLRALHTAQGGIQGAMPGNAAVVDAFGNATWPHSQMSPGDLPANYGGRFNDLGVGLDLQLPGLGGRLGLEWLAPVRDRPRGDQLARRGTLVFRWHMMF